MVAPWAKKLSKDTNFLPNITAFGLSMHVEHRTAKFIYSSVPSMILRKVLTDDLLVDENKSCMSQTQK